MRGKGDWGVRPHQRQRGRVVRHGGYGHRQAG